MLGLGQGYTKYFSALGFGGLFDSKKPPAYAKALVYITSALAERGGYTYLVDKKGTRDGEVLQGACYDFGSDATARVEIQNGLLGASSVKFDIQTTSAAREAILGGILDSHTIYINNGQIGTGAGTLNATSNTFNDGVKHEVEIEIIGLDTYIIKVDGITQSLVNDSGWRDSVNTGFGRAEATNGNYTLFYSGYLGNVRPYNVAGELINWWQCVEGSKDKCLDCRGGAHGTILNATLANFHAPNNNFPNRANTDGYSEGVYGNNTVLNGDFLSGQTSWYIFQTPWSVINSKANIDGTQTSRAVIGQKDQLFVDETYKIKSLVSNVQAGSFKFSRAGSLLNSTFSSDGIAEEIYTMPSSVSNNDFYISADADFIGSVDDISIQQLYTQRVPLQYNEDGTPTSLDIFGNTPTYLGRVRNNVQVTGSYCLEFDGLTKHIIANAALPLATDDFIIKYKIKKDSVAQLNICGQGTDGNNYWRIRVVGNVTYFDVKDAGVTTTFSAAKSTINEWEETAITVNRATGVTFNIGGEEFFDAGVITDNLTHSNVFGVGTVPIILSGNDFSGLFSEISVENSSLMLEYHFSNGEGNTVQNVANPGTPDGTLVNFTTSGVSSDWVVDDGATYHNLTKGFDKWEVDASPGTYILIPYDIDGNPILTDGDTYAGHTWKSTHPKISGKQFHNGSENGLKWPISPELKAADSDNVLFTGDTPNELFFADLQAATINPIFLRDAVTRLEELTLYDADLTGAELTAANTYFGI